MNTIERNIYSIVTGDGETPLADAFITVMQMQKYNDLSLIEIMAERLGLRGLAVPLDKLIAALPAVSAQIESDLADAQRTINGG